MYKTLLNKVLNKVNQEYFSFEKLPPIKLSKGQEKSQRRAMVFGTYHIKKNEIKIHPVLIQQHIPSFILEFIIYHELLHYQDRSELLKRKKGDRVHTTAFKKREKGFLHYKEAQIILKQILCGKIVDLNLAKQINSENLKTFQKTRKILSGEKLENALAESLKRLEQVLIKHNIIKEKIKGVKRGIKKKNDENQLVGDA